MFYLISSSALKSEAPVPVERHARHSLDTDDPSGRSCSRRQLRSPRSGTLAGIAFCNSRMGRLASSCNRRIVFIVLVEIFWLLSQASGMVRKHARRQL